MIAAISGAEAFALLITAAGTLITAIAGFIVVLRRQNDAITSQNATTARVEQVYEHVNHIESEVADDGEPMTLGRAVRQIGDRLTRIERELGIQE